MSRPETRHRGIKGDTVIDLRSSLDGVGLTHRFVGTTRSFEVGTNRTKTQTFSVEVPPIPESPSRHMGQ